MKHYLFAVLVTLFLSFGQTCQAQLPAPLPQIESIVTGDPSPGYIFIGPRSRSITDTLPGSIMVCDNTGKPVWHFSLLNNGNFPYANSYPVDFKLLNDSTMSFGTRRSGDYEFHFLDTDFNLIDTFRCFETDEHEMLQDNQGNLYYLCKEYTTEDCSGLNQANGNPGNPNCTVLSITMVVEDPAGNIIRQWNTLDHIAIEETQSVYYTNASNLDHAHTNSIAFDLDSNLILCHRNNFQIMKINRFSGDVMWRMGGDNNEFTFIGDTIPFTAQHDARIAPNGNLYLFDNAFFQTTARYVEYELDTVAMTATLVREHFNPSGESSAIMGGAQLLPDSNVIVCWGGNFLSTHLPKITEFEPDGDITMEMKFPFGFTSYRAQKTSLPFQIERPQLICDNGSLTLSAPSGYTTYAWNTGETTQSIAINDTGTYQVWVNYGVGFVSSLELEVTDLNNICSGVSSQEATPLEKISLFPNPAVETFTIEIPGTLAGGWELEVRDLAGRILLHDAGRNTGKREFNISALASGMYEVLLEGNGQVYSAKLVRQ